MVPLNMTYLHYLQHFLFEHLFNLCCYHYNDNNTNTDQQEYVLLLINSFNKTEAAFFSRAGSASLGLSLSSI